MVDIQSTTTWLAFDSLWGSCRGLLCGVLCALAGGCGDGPSGFGSRNRELATRAGFMAVYDEALVPSRLAECARYQAGLGVELAGHVAALPGVRDASVVVSLPACDPLGAMLGTSAPASASVVVVVSDPREHDVDIASLVAGAVPGLRAEQVVVSVGAAPGVDAQPRALATIGPFPVAPSARRPLLAIAALLLGLIVALALWAFVGERVNAALRARIAQLEWESAESASGDRAAEAAIETTGTASSRSPDGR